LKIGLFFFAVLSDVCRNITTFKEDEDGRGVMVDLCCQGKAEVGLQRKKIIPVPICPE